MQDIAARARRDGEFRLAIRHWTGGFRLRIGDELIGLRVIDGEAHEGVPEPDPMVIELSGPGEVWEPMLRPVPPPFANTVVPNIGPGRLERGGDEMTWWQYLPATERLIELLRGHDDNASRTPDHRLVGHAHDAPVGRYVHVPIDGHDYRLYYEEAGQGIPLLLQHTAGAHGVQWRHLFEDSTITSRFRLIAYDLPYHGKSVPPATVPWWEQEYRLTGDFLRRVPVGLAEALGLVDPVFMGCSVGGLLALDLALHHGDLFRAVISVEGALHIGGDHAGLTGFLSPQVSNTSKARMMEGLCAPTSPVPYVKEVSQTYAAGWPPVFLGDLFYYMVDFDLRERAREIDTSRCAVHILNGEYDYSGSVAKGLEAHRAIAGSTHRAMGDIGHFPMVENPDRFISELSPVLDEIAAANQSEGAVHAV